MSQIVSIRRDQGSWDPYPIDPAIVLDGDPRATVRWLRASGEGEAPYYAGLWRAERSRFRWHFDFHESAQILAGRIRVTGPDGAVREYVPGDFVYFAKGTDTVWEILEPLEKFFIDTP